MPKSKEQFEQIKEERKENIIKKSLYLFAFHGYSEVKIDDITKASECSHGLFYHYFATKEDVFHAVMEYCASTIMNKQRTINLNQKAKFLLHDLLEEICQDLRSSNSDYACIHYLLLNLHLQKKTLPPPPKTDRPKHKRIFDFMAEIIEKGQQEGDFGNGNPYEYVIAILSMINGLAYNRLKLGYKKFICPNSQIMMNIVLKK